ncbi:MAG: AraC family transcriptional regulator ligand-binding domain-containing protein, partial [Porticoccus sp.]|nr:AraC family transcriptional regulator ligand-binding domain-containing protein [Porticoccus sp.]
MKELLACDVEQLGLQRLLYGLGPLVTYLKEHGVDCKKMFAAANIPPGAIGDPTAMMGLQQEQMFTLAAIKELGEPGLGLSIGPS